MPSPRWSESKQPFVAGAIAAAVSAAWDGPQRGRTQRFTETLRKALGPDLYERVEVAAFQVLMLQESAPEGYDPLPEWALFRVCPKCSALQRTKFTAPQNGRIKLQVLRDRNWMERALERGESYASLARKLGVAPANVAYFAEKHGLKSARSERREELEAIVRHMHAQREGPGAIAKAADTSVHHVLQALKRLGLATKKSGQVYHEKEWWRVRLVEQGKTKLQCAREAGIRPHAANYWLKQFGLQHLVTGNKRRPKYPVLRDRTELRLLLARHDNNYESVARELGCAPSLVSWYARRTLGVAQKHFNDVPHSKKSWWTERLERGATTYELAEEAGIAEKSAREKLRVLGLLEHGYRNNTARERKRRSA